MKTLRRSLALLLILCAAVLPLISGCHGARGLAAFEIPEAFDTTREYEITFWAKNDTNRTQTKIYEQAIADFETLYPNIHVNLRLYTDYGKIYNDVITNIATNTTPNVCITYPDHIATYLTGVNVVVPLDDLMDDPVYGLGGSAVSFDAPSREEIVPYFLEECSFAGHWYALPFMRSTEACYVNRTYVEALGFQVPDVLTWDFVWEVSEAAMRKGADGNYLVNGQSVMIPFIYKSTDNMMIQMTQQRGTGYSTEDGEILLFNDSTAELLYTVAEHSATGAFSTFKISSYPGNFFNAGQCIFAVDSTAGATWIGSDAPLQDIASDRIVRFETEVRMVPQFDPEHPQMISQGPSVCVFNKTDPQEVLASWLFVQYLLSDGVQIAYSETEGYVPVTTRAQEREDYLDYLSRAGEDNTVHYAVKIQAAQLLLDHAGDTFTTPVYNGSTSLRDAAGQLIENVAKDTRRHIRVDDEYIRSLYDSVISLYRLDQLRGASTGEKTDLGPLPPAAIALLSALGAIWVLLGLSAAYTALKRGKKRQNTP